MTASTDARPRPAALPYLQVRDARAAIDWYARALGAAPLADPIIMDDNRVGHAELAINGGVLYLADEFPEMGLTGPPSGVTSVSLMLHVDDTDAWLEQALSHGASQYGEVHEQFEQRLATFVDPFGHRWMLSGPTKG
jgi:uncharacterized glyoxalase superfamily protein PhnB